MSSKIVLNVQVLRGIAALLVVICHLQPMLNTSFGTHLEFKTGSFGVDIFFIISGFVMYYQGDRVDRPILPFIVARIFRIVPLYWLATILVVIFFQFGFHPNGLAIFRPAMLLQSMVFVRSVMRFGQYSLILSLGWTLIYELFFYLVFACTFPMKTARRSLIVVALVFLGLIGFGRTSVGALLHPNLLYFTDPIVLEFLMGGALALTVQWHDRRAKPAPRWVAPVSIVAILAGFTLALARSGATEAPADTIRWLVWGGPAFLIVAGAIALDKSGHALKSGAMLRLGVASYALYLFHPLVMQPLVKLLARVIPLRSVPGIVTAEALAIVAAILAAILVHYAIELRMLKLGRTVVRRMGDRHVSRQVQIEDVARATA